MSAPRTKRQYAGGPGQQQITAFFNKSASSSTIDDAASGTAPSVPALPSQVQANLLSVGMRVRKSVPEGYKTGSAYSAFSLWSENDHGKPSRSDLPTISVSSSGGGIMANSASRELTPFCGIHKVGGLAVQPQTPPSSAVAGSGSDLDDEVPGLTSSQATASTINLLSSPAVTRKRFYLTEEEEEQAINNEISAAAASATTASSWRSHDDWLQDDEVSPRSLAPMAWTGHHTNNNNSAHGSSRNSQSDDSSRILAVPRSRKAPGIASLASVAAAGATAAAAVAVADDFEEAAFLDYPTLLGETSGEMELE